MTQQEIEPSSPQIFISYAREDEKFVRRLANDLKEAGFRTWWDRKIPAGKSFPRYIEDNIADSHYCLVILTPAAVRSEWVESEYLTAYELGLHVFPILYQDCKKPMRFRAV